MQDPIKSPKITTTLQLRHVSTIGKTLLSSNISSTCPHNMVNFVPLAAEIVLLVWDTPANFNWFRILAALLHGTLVVGISQTLRRWTEGATYVRQGDHHVGHWPTFLVYHLFLVFLSTPYLELCFYLNIAHTSDHSHLCSLKCHLIFFPDSLLS